ncbi:MAG: hypothetical protein M1609_02300 [Firmicutes bacterium]|nr:hypothetical protein [Bacillota bacterium]
MINMRRWCRTIIIDTGLVLILGAVVWLNRPLQLPYTTPLPLAPATQAEPCGSSPVLNSRPGFPEITPNVFKGQGDLAFVWDGLLYVLYGRTGGVKQLTESGQALQPFWSPHGEWLAFMRLTDPQVMSGPLWLVRRDGSQAHQVQGLPFPATYSGRPWPMS